MSDTPDPHDDAPLEQQVAGALSPYRWRPRELPLDELGQQVEAPGAARPAAAGPAASDPPSAFDELTDLALEAAARYPAPTPKAVPTPLPAPVPATTPTRVPSPSRPLRLVPWALAASLVLAAILAVRSGPSGSFGLETLAGAPRVESGHGGKADRLSSASLAVGQRLVCADGDRAQVVVGAAGTLKLEPGSVLLAQAFDDSGWQLRLERGALSASIFAAPGRFRVDTPAGLAVDMGCVYHLSVDEDGVTSLRVTGGLVSFAGGARTIWVPEGASARAYPDGRVTIPVWDDAVPWYGQIAEEVDAWAASPEPAVLTLEQRGVLAKLFDLHHERDTLTAWHLLDHPWAEVRYAAVDALQAVRPAPSHLSPQALRAGDQHARDEWRAYLSFWWHLQR